MGCSSKSTKTAEIADTKVESTTTTTSTPEEKPAQETPTVESEKTAKETTVVENKQSSQSKAVEKKSEAKAEVKPKEEVKVSEPKSGTVYWVSGGKSYHGSKGCPTLARSKNIYSGTIAESGKHDPCDKCAY